MKINLYVYGKTDKLTDLIPVEDANPTDYPISREFCQLVQALELSSEFQRDIEKARIQLNVNPDIVDLTSYIKAELLRANMTIITKSSASNRTT